MQLPVPFDDDDISLRSMIRRTRGVCLVSEGTLYERANDALNGARSGGRSALPDYTIHHTPDLRQTLPEGHQLFAKSFLAHIVCEKIYRKLPCCL